MGKTEETDLVRESLTELLSEMEKIENHFENYLSEVSPENSLSAKNLLHYLAVRSFDIRRLQYILAKNGLSSLGRSEAFIKSSVGNVLKYLHQPGQFFHNSQPDMEQAEKIHERNLNALLGPPSDERMVRIMVTLDKEAAENEAFCLNLLKSGMNCIRINCAHDNREIWEKIIRNLRKASAATGLPCRILMDIAGPKIRTGKIRQGPKVIKVRPERDILGKVINPFIIGLTKGPYTYRNSIHYFTVKASLLESIYPGKTIHYKDSRGRKRKLKALEKDSEGNWVCSGKRTCYIRPGTKVRLYIKKQKISSAIGDMPGTEVPILLKKGDTLMLYRSMIPGEPAKVDKNGKLISPAGISCTNATVFNDLSAGHQILFDDGKISGIISAVNPEALTITITGAEEKGSNLRADKGINFPDSVLGSLETFSEKDRQDLAFIAKNADIVNMSFIYSAEDVNKLLSELNKLDARNIGVMVKIETRSAVNNLPEIILALQKAHKAGIMIARGDLAIEAGWGRMAEVQEEMLWLAEAAHLPVVWATQVLESLAKKGLPSRAEITDAAMSQRADCVMLNKGPYIIRAVQLLDDILKRMKDHQKKKTPMLRKLNLAENFIKKAKADPARQQQNYSRL